MARTITVKEDGVEVYHGEDKRFYDKDYKKDFFGIAVADWFKMAIYIVGIIVFLVKADIRISSLEDSQKKLTEISDSFKQYMEAADGWHSSMVGTQFKGGRPIDGSFKSLNRGNI